jgi:hypothetical protein
VAASRGRWRFMAGLLVNIGAADQGIKMERVGS